jgi:hypothetical protein
MCPAVDNPTSCEIRALNRLLLAKNVTAKEIHNELRTALCDQDVISEGTIRQWCRMLKDGRKNVRDEERSGRSAMFSK